MVLRCGSQVSTTWKTKAQALKWLKAMNKVPCSGPCREATSLCGRGGFFGKVYDLKTKGYVWSAIVNCPCGPPLVSGRGGALTMWTQVRPKRKTRATRA
jgi:hypothetical protein